MKFSKAIDSVLKQNLIYRFSIIALGLVCVAQSVFCIKLLGKEALVVERTGSETKALNLQDNKRTKEEIQNFLNLSLKSRFNTFDDKNLNFLNKKEQEFKVLEQKELKEKGIDQEILIRNILFQDGGGFKIKSERIIRHEKAKALLDFNVLVGLKTVERTLKNPYGLILETLKTLKESENKEDK